MTDRATHTPGPWVLLTNGVCVAGSDPHAHDVGMSAVAHCGMARRPEAESRANAQLVMAAPDLSALAHNFEITGPDADGLVWFVLRGNSTKVKAMFQLGTADRLSVQAALHLETERRAAIAKTTGAQP